MGMSYRRYLSGERIYGCSKCKTHLATIHTMMSRVMKHLIHGLPWLTIHATGIQRPAWSSVPLRWRASLPSSYLFHYSFIIQFSSVNVIEGEPDDRPMTTGNHTVRDIYCCKCGTTLGWKYVNTPD
jgi:hypothetical protein